MLRLTPIVAVALAASPAAAKDLSAEYAAAILFCRGLTDPGSYQRFYREARNSVGLNPERTVGCFNGAIWDEDADDNVAIIRQLAKSSIFVIRSNGGSRAAAARLADVLMERDATVVAYDICHSACASYIAVATRRTFVAKDTLFTWHVPKGYEWFCRGKIRGDLECLIAQDGGAAPTLDTASRKFFETRVKDITSFVHPPTSPLIRRIIKASLSVDSVRPMDSYRGNISWTLHPKRLATIFKTEIVYEAYPVNQQEVDILARKLNLPRVIFDE